MVPLLKGPWEQEEEVPDHPGGQEGSCQRVKAVHELAWRVRESLGGMEAYFRQRWRCLREQVAIWELW